jgi:integrase
VHPLIEDQLRALLGTCVVAADARPDLLLQQRRDEAIIRLMLETAIRKGEVVALEVGDVDLDAGLVTIRRGKGGRGRVIPIGPFANRGLRAYLLLRARHPLAATPPHWLGTRSRPMGYEGLHNTLRRRAQRGGIDGFHPHRLRHTAAHRWLAKGGSEAGLMAIAGWSRTDMLVRYTRACASQRAAEEAWRLNLGAL